MLVPGDAAILIPISLISAVPRKSSSVVSSKGITASARSGIGAPVIIRDALPGSMGLVGKDPAAIVSMTSRFTVLSWLAAVTSCDLTAYPSIAELSKVGMLIPDLTFSAITNPTESDIGNVSASRGSNSRRICWRAFSTLSMSS